LSETAQLVRIAAAGADEEAPPEANTGVRGWWTPYCGIRCRGEGDAAGIEHDRAPPLAYPLEEITWLSERVQLNQGCTAVSDIDGAAAALTLVVVTTFFVSMQFRMVALPPSQ